MISYKARFSRFLAAAPGRLHVAAHSHHLWPDVTFAAQQRCWEDAARLADRKWEHIFAEVYPRAQQACARLLGLPDPATLAFGPNTHDFVMRLLSALPAGFPTARHPIELLTSDSEFHSFARQARRLEEEGAARVTRIAAEPFESFPTRFVAAARRQRHDLVFLSHVFFNSGWVVPGLPAIVAAVEDPATMVVIDGYHGFFAVPTDLAPMADRAFYLAGGYKYAMAGEGAALVHAPPGAAQRPLDTGWYAGFGALEAGAAGGVGYAADGSRFLGATFDPVGLYRLDAVFGLLDELGLTVEAIHARVQALQALFVERLAALSLEALHPGQLVVPLEAANRGHFLTFRTPAAGDLHRALLDRAVVTDVRADRLRFGFGLYHDPEDVERLCEIVSDLRG